jgi:hypothetical protein
VELMGKGEEYNSSYVYCQAKGWSKRVQKIFSMILERVFEIVSWHSAAVCFVIDGNFSCALVEPPHILPFLSP